MKTAIGEFFHNSWKVLVVFVVVAAMIVAAVGFFSARNVAAQATTVLDVVTAERDVLALENGNLKAEVQVTTDQRNGLQTQVDQLVAEKAKAVSDQAALQANLDLAIGDKKALQEQLDAIAAEAAAKQAEAEAAVAAQAVTTYTEFRAQEALKICKEDSVIPALDGVNVPTWTFELPGNSYVTLYVGNGLLSSADGKTSVPIKATGGENLVSVFNPTDGPLSFNLNGYPNFSYHLFCPGQIPDLEKMAGGSVGVQPDNLMTCGLTGGCPSATISNVALDEDGVTLIGETLITEFYNFSVGTQVPMPPSTFWESAAASGIAKLQEMQDQNAVVIKLTAGQYARVTVPEGKQHRLDIPAGMAVKILNSATGEVLFDSPDGGIAILECAAPDNVTFLIEAGSDGNITHYEYRYGFQVTESAPTILATPAGQALRAASVPVIIKYSYDGTSTSTEEIVP